MQPIHSIESNYGLIINISVTIINPGLRRARKGRRREEEEGRKRKGRSWGGRTEGLLMTIIN